MTKHSIYTMSFASVYPHYVTKAERKGRTKKEIGGVIHCLTGYTQRELNALLKKEPTSKRFSKKHPIKETDCLRYA